VRTSATDGAGGPRPTRCFKNSTQDVGLGKAQEKGNGREKRDVTFNGPLPRRGKHRGGIRVSKPHEAHRTCTALEVRGQATTRGVKQKWGKANPKRRVEKGVKGVQRRDPEKGSRAKAWKKGGEGGCPARGGGDFTRSRVSRSGKKGQLAQKQAAHPVPPKRRVWTRKVQTDIRKKDNGGTKNGNGRLPETQNMFHDFKGGKIPSPGPAPGTTASGYSYDYF